MKTKDTYNKSIFFFFISIFILAGCSKSWLDEKPSKNLVVPETLKDYQSILDQEVIFNSGYSNFGIPSTDLVYIADADFDAQSQEIREMYTWSEEINYYNDEGVDWQYFYRHISYANLILDGLSKFENTAEVNVIRGQARFMRALGYYYLAQTFCKPYLKENANTDLGLPMRLTSDVNQIATQRSTLQQVYDQILADLYFASYNLDYDTKYHTRANKTSALALLSKTFLTMQDYNKSRLYADSVLKVKSELIDFNNSQLVSHDLTYKFPSLGIGNPEIIFYAKGRDRLQYNYAGFILQVAQDFYETYSESDLRKEFFYTRSGTRNNFVGSYSGDMYLFQGISTNEMYFIRSECNARLNNMEDARNDLNTILKYRYKTDEVPIVTENNQEALLRIIFTERTKEFPRVSNIWWEDLRRLNLDTRFQRTLNRTVKGQVYTLQPNDPRYVFPIPRKEIRLSGIETNER